jgi:MarR family transcriptional regulator for hemolysin
MGLGRVGRFWHWARSPLVQPLRNDLLALPPPTPVAATEPVHYPGFDPKLLLTMRMVLAARRWRALLDERLRPLGHSSPRMETLSAIANSPKLSAQVDIARRIGVEGPTLTRMLDQLESDGLVKRLPDPSDRRTKRIKLTKKGETTLADINAAADELRSQLLAGFAPGAVDGANQFMAEWLDRLAETAAYTA